jgi:hypothetical protein
MTTTEEQDDLPPEDPAALALIRWQNEHPQVWGDQDENGVDIARLRENLKLTPAQRLRKLDVGRKMLRLLQNARR